MTRLSPLDAPRAEPRFLSEGAADRWLRLTAFWLTHRDSDPHQLVDAMTSACLDGHGTWASDLPARGAEAHSLTLFGITATGTTSRATADVWRRKAGAEIARHATKRAAE